MKILQKKANHLAAAVFSALMLTAAIGAPAVSAEHYNVYNYDCWGEAVPAQAGYAAQRAVSGQDLGCGAFNTPSDLFRDWEDRFYIADGNNRIVVTDGDFSKATRIYDKLKTEDGETTLKDPEGIYVSQETQCMYIADTGNSRLLVCDLDGNVVDGSEAPSSDTASHAYIYRHMPDVYGVVHTHSTYATAWAATGQNIPCGLTMMGDEFGGPVPVGPFRLIGSEAIGEGVVETLREYPKSPAVLTPWTQPQRWWRTTSGTCSPPIRCVPTRPVTWRQASPALTLTKRALSIR